MHPNANDLTNQVFGKIKVLEPSIERRNGSIIWRCLCECGQEAMIRATALTRKRNAVKSCGCVKYQELPTGESDFNALMIDYKRGAAKRDYDFTLSADEAKALFTAPCHYCGAVPSQRLNHGPRGRNGGFLYNGIDRMNNSIGYVSGNCASCCKICNRAKSTMPYDQFLGWLERLTAFRSSQKA